MARFRGEVWGRSKTVASRLGNASGMSSHTRGWNVGARVECFTDDEIDIIQIYGTHGSNSSRTFRIATLRHNPNGDHYSVVLHKDAEKEGRNAGH